MVLGETEGLWWAARTLCVGHIERNCFFIPSAVIVNAKNSSVEMIVYAHSEVCKWIDCVAWNTTTQLLYTAFNSFLESFIPFIAMKLEKEGKLEILIRN